MEPIKKKNLVLGGGGSGLVLGVGEYVINDSILGVEWVDTYQRLGLPGLSILSEILLLLATGILGFVLVWLYASLKPRFPRRSISALVSAALIWVLVFLYPAFFVGGLGLISKRLIVIEMAWGGGLLILAVMVGSWLYKR